MAASPQSKPNKRWIRPHYSWSQYNCFLKQGWPEYCKRYLYGDNETNPAMELGKIVADMIEHDQIQEEEVLEHLRTFLPHSTHHEYEMRQTFCGINLVGYYDGFDEPSKEMPFGKLDEYKTGRLWTQEMADKTEQFDWYVLLWHLKYGHAPEKLPLRLIWMPTEWNGGNPKVTGEIEIFETRRTMLDVIRTGKKIVDSWNKIGILVAEEYEAIGI